MKITTQKSDSWQEIEQLIIKQYNPTHYKKLYFQGNDFSFVKKNDDSVQVSFIWGNSLEAFKSMFHAETKRD